MLGLLAALYSIYLLYTGIPVLMKAPQEKALGYTAVLIVCGIVAGMIVGAVTAMFSGAGHGTMMGSATPPSEVNIKVPGSDVTINTAKLEEAAKRWKRQARKWSRAGQGRLGRGRQGAG